MKDFNYINSIVPIDGFIVFQIFSCLVFYFSVLILCFIGLQTIFNKKYSTKLWLCMFYWLGTGIGFMVLGVIIGFKLSLVGVQPYYLLFVIFIFTNSVFITYTLLSTFFTNPWIQKEDELDLSSTKDITLGSFWKQIYGQRKLEKNWLKFLEIPFLFFVTLYNSLSKVYLLWATFYFFILKECWLELYSFSDDFYWLPLFLFFFLYFCLGVFFSTGFGKTHFKDIYGDDILVKLGWEKPFNNLNQCLFYCFKTLVVLKFWWVSTCIVDFFISVHLNQVECNLLWNEWVVALQMNADFINGLEKNADFIKALGDKTILKIHYSEPDCSELLKQKIIFRIKNYFS